MRDSKMLATSSKQRSSHMRRARQEAKHETCRSSHGARSHVPRATTIQLSDHYALGVRTGAEWENYSVEVECELVRNGKKEWLKIPEIHGSKGEELQRKRKRKEEQKAKKAQRKQEGQGPGRPCKAVGPVQQATAPPVQLQQSETRTAQRKEKSRSSKPAVCVRPGQAAFLEGA
eukprot:1145587-Pelagomonas_calceolata.AAC.3